MTSTPEKAGPAVVSLLLIYYWAVQYAQVSGELGERGNLVYFLLIVPITLFVIISFFRFMSSNGALNRPAKIFLLFEGIIITVALIRGDFQTVLTLGLLCTTIVVILSIGAAPSATLLNGLFLASIPAIIIAYALGRSNYTIGPGGMDAVWWRVSIFPQVATSAFFSGLVFLMNVIYRDGRFRKITLVLSLYFLLFSGLRSAVIASAIAFSYLILRRRGLLFATKSKMMYMGFALAGFVIILLAPEILLALSTSDNPLNFFLFRSNEAVSDKDAVVQTIFRTMLWKEHFRIAQENWLFGIGSFNFASKSDELGHLTSGSESFLTATYARVGIAVVLFVAGILSAVRSGLHQHKDIVMVVGIMIFVAMMTYGGFIAAYDFTFLTMMALLAGAQQPIQASRSRSATQSYARTAT